MNLLLLHSPPSIPLLKFSCNYKPKTSTHIIKAATTKPIPARDRVIDFGKHKGKFLGTLPSNYLKWVSKNLRARDFEDWANLADQVLNDPVYRDRIEWELADKLLNGDVSSSRSDSGVSDLLEISKRFGWDNDDKIGWKKIDFSLLGTSKGGRIPRISGGGGGERELRLKREKVRACEVEGGEESRGERRGRLRVKRGNGRQSATTDTVMKDKDMPAQHDEEVYGDRTVENRSSRFPGREGLLKKVHARGRL